MHAVFISLFVIEVGNIPFSQLKTEVLNETAITFFKSKGGIREDCAVKQKNVLQNKVQLFDDKTNLSFLCLGTSKISSLGEFDE